MKLRMDTAYGVFSENRNETNPFFPFICFGSDKMTSDTGELEYILVVLTTTRDRGHEFPVVRIVEETDDRLVFEAKDQGVLSINKLTAELYKKVRTSVVPPMPESFDEFNDRIEEWTQGPAGFRRKRSQEKPEVSEVEELQPSEEREKPDFENTPVTNDDGKIIRYADGKPVLYKHFLNDLPDDDDPNLFRNQSPENQLSYIHGLGYRAKDFDKSLISLEQELDRKKAEEEKKKKGSE